MTNTAQDADTGAEPDHGPWQAVHRPAHARSRSGGVSVTTTAQGLPLAVRIETSELRKDPAVLATEVLRLCRRAAMSAGVALRADLLAAGVDRDLVDTMALPRADDLARTEYADDAAADAPASWLRRG
ncbi:hypothetical protein QSJ18_08160 [Gordonia sp. ABSL1-1]|uniref:hypothetical protein n=1 Tax=Gordonia sp. ABSL1-1 TaxID=3053923 RepID=UPI0025743884|nr:hypothetical protein [Gordonia sp. ABSL1-1]MDL9936710.1 hypothetical protein [Gordonia sp. ABSL1-1]